jgi:hypothetical protein
MVKYLNRIELVVSLASVLQNTLQQAKQSIRLDRAFE